jgi:hypothetical protein
VRPNIDDFAKLRVTSLAENRGGSVENRRFCQGAVLVDPETAEEDLARATI